MSKIIILVFSFLIASANSFHFTELRYSKALDKSIELNGEISFFKNGLSVNYKDAKKSLHLRNGKLTYKEDSQEISLKESQTQQITQYLETIILLHDGNEKLLNNIFNVQTTANKSILTPKGSLHHFVATIELTKKETTLKEIKLFLQNSDQITIKIDYEIH